ncbi:MAG: PilT/PilU family type 4a pilus ATPase [Alphaproteobacteria bacterium]|nr:PilT/PilU family type 4a pilus ATPase [Alphaproteobacteria bacterium]NCQ87769.1 PilT/PilU family type 4a pilus ATPase [Alphaproteobacteria bacterium]NCT05723.1 PilT/PilU family type 4a pilus ATPase [Alphaproteobacteria bacterium]
MDTSTIFSFLTQMNTVGASDLYLTVGRAPVLRVEDAFQTVDAPSLDPESVQEIIYSILTAKQRREFDVNWELNTSLDMGKHGRFRINVMRQRQNPSLVIRRIVSKIPTIAELNLPPILQNLAMERRGLVLVTGMTGSGKSTSLASMLNYRNQHKEGHIITIEDPIEYYHEHSKSIITQREIGIDTESYRTALKNSLRQRPDVILIGEIRDKEVMEQALTIAETGHLCLATLHTNNAYQAIERVVNFFPEEQGQQIRLNLSMNLKAIVSQRLIPSIEGALVPAIEIMINEALVRELIAEGRYEKVTEVMEKNTNIGMQTFDQSILALYKSGLITEETVLNQSDKVSDIKVKLQQIKMGQNSGSLQNMDTSLLKVSD